MKKCHRCYLISVFLLFIVALVIFVLQLVIALPVNFEGFSTGKTSISFVSRFSARLSMFATPSLYPMSYSTSLVSSNMSSPSPLMSMISSFGPVEIAFRTGLTGKSTVTQAAAAYSKYLLDFTSTEQNRIKSLITSTTELPKNKWIFIKKADSLDGGESLILGDYICLSQKDTVTLSSEAPLDDEETDSRLMLLLSLLIYKIIKSAPKNYEKFYRQLGFNAIPHLTLPPDLQMVRYSDPNVPLGDWSFGLDGTEYWSTRVIRDNALKTETYVVIKTGDFYQVVFPAVDSSIICQGLGVDDNNKIYHPACMLTLNPMILHVNDMESSSQSDDQPMTI